MVTKMKPLPKLWKLLSIAISLIGINGNACRAQTQGPPTITALPPLRYKCLDLLELERIKADPKTGRITTNDMQLAADYQGVVGWLRGFFTAFNHHIQEGDVTKGTTPYQMMTWIFSYCRAHPSETLNEAAFEFVDAMRATKN
jgi:hypothetical protein